MANHVLIQKIELSQSTASITFANIPQTGYTDLKIVASARVGGGNVGEVVNIAFNGSTSNISARILYGDAPNALSITSTSNGFWVVGSGATSSTFGNSELYFPNYTSSSNKSWSTDSVLENNSGTYLVLLAGLWSQTASINSITFTPPTQSFVANSTFSLYGVAATGTSPSSGPKASGGNTITTDGTYWSHTFLSSGTFTPLGSLTADYLVVAGGGGGGKNQGGGGGAGGLRSTVTATGGGGSSEIPLSLTAQAYSVTVGAGGNGSTGDSAAGSNGSNSVFSTITSIGGGGGGSANGSPSTFKDGQSGGSGGGESGDLSGAGAGGPGTSNQGFAGGIGANNASNRYNGGGGGGAGVIGTNATTSVTGAGGNGVANSISGSSVTYAGGGSGGAYQGNVGVTIGAAGTGGGALGNTGTTAQANAATTNTGGGGGGGGATNAGAAANGGNGGSGIVIIRYAV
jgi:hypothetical protein